MSMALSLDNAHALRRIRTLRLERAMLLAAGSRAAVDAAEAVVTQRSEEAQAIRGALDGLREAIGSTLAAELPRWVPLIFARQQRLAEQLARAEDKLLTACRRLDDARKALQHARVELAIAQRREQIADELARRARRRLEIERERKLEREAEPMSNAARSAR